VQVGVRGNVIFFQFRTTGREKRAIFYAYLGNKRISSVYQWSSFFQKKAVF
jgi:hypothetical protein